MARNRMSGSLQLTNVQLPLAGDGYYTLEASDGHWTRIERQPEGLFVEGDGAASDRAISGRETVIDGSGQLVLPGFVDMHTHLDKAFSLEAAGNRSGTLGEAITSYSNAYPGFTTETLQEQIKRTALLAVSQGTVAIRSHLDFQSRYGKEAAFRTVHAALEAREALRDVIDLQFFLMTPSFGDHAEVWEWIEEALQLGIDGLGGAPHIAPDPQALTDRIFRIAMKYDKPIDLHVDESDDPAKDTALYLAEKTIAEGYEGRVIAGHLCSLSAMPAAQADLIISRLAAARIGAVTLPASNLYLQGREDRGPVRRGVTRIRELLEAGVPLAAASDNIQDAFHPFGSADLLQIGLLTAYAAQLGTDADLHALLRMLTEVPAALTNQNQYVLAVGRPATFALIGASSLREMFSRLPANRQVFRRGVQVGGEAR